MSDPAIRDATHVLERLSADPAAQRLADERDRAMMTYKIEITAARQEGIDEGEARGKAEGEARGEAEGEAQGLRVAIEDLCEAFGLTLDATQRAELEAADVDALGALRLEIKRTRRWPATSNH